MPTSSDHERTVRGSGLRVPRPRPAVLSVVHGHPHADTRSILALVRRDVGAVSHQAGDDVLRDLTGAVGDAPCLTPADGSGYAITDADLVFWGRCARCAAATTPSG